MRLSILAHFRAHSDHRSSCCSGRKLGSGGFADVFVAEHHHLGTVALKEIRSSSQIQCGGAELRREMETWSKLRHPNIVQIMGASDFNTEFFILTELVLPDLTP